MICGNRINELKSTVKNKIKGMKCMQGFVATVRVYKYPDYKQWMQDYFSGNTLKFEELGELNPNKNIYYMYLSAKSNGFFTYWRYAMNGLMFCERYNFTPVIDWTSNSPYFEEEGINGIKNPFEYYYEPLSNIKCEDAKKSKNVVVYSENSAIARKEFYKNDFKEDEVVKINKKYIKLKKNVADLIQNNIEQLLGDKKTLAVHIRGVEWGKIKNHPMPIELEEYIKKIEEAIEKYKFEQIFLATDSEKTIDYLSNKYGNKLIFYKDAIRTPKDSHTLAIFDNTIKREKNNYLLGLEVLRDMMTLASCQGIIAGTSNVSTAAYITKLSNDEEYIYKYIFEPKINRTGINVSKAVNKMQKQKWR